MKAALKFIMTLAGLLLIAANIGTVLLLTQFEGLLRSGLTRQAGQILQTEVHLEAVHIDWSRQALEFKGISIFNPRGFSDREAIRIGSVRVHPQMLAIFAKTPVLTRIALRETEIHLQYNDTEGTNLGAMMNHAREWAEQQVRGEAWVLGRPLAVHELAFDPIRLHVQGGASGEPDVSLTMDAFSVTNPAGEGAVSGAGMIHLVLQSIATQLTSLDGVVNAVKETLVLEASPATADLSRADEPGTPALPSIRTFPRIPPSIRVSYLSSGVYLCEEVERLNFG